MDNTLRRLGRQDPYSLVYFHERVRAGELLGIEEGCRDCGGTGAHPNPVMYGPPCPTCQGTGRSTIEERLHMAGNLGYKKAWEYVDADSGRVAVFTLSNPIRWVEEYWGSVAAAACVRGACRLDKKLSKSYEQMAPETVANWWALACSGIGKPRAYEAARLAGIRFALGIDEVI